MNIKFLSITILFSLMATVLLAQQQDSVKVKIVNSGCSIHSANITLGYASPEMDYWNDSYLPAMGISETLDANLAVGANITFNLPANFRARVGASYWGNEAEGNSAASIDALKINLTRVNLGLMYAPVAISFGDFQPYVGAELQSMFVKNTYTVDGDEITQNGSDIGFAPLVGIDRAFGAINLGLEFKYNIGSYVQEEAAEQTVEHDVSVNGVEVALVIGYRF